MAAVAVFMMIMVAFAPMASVFTDDQGADAAFTTGDFNVTVTDKGKVPIFGLTVTATLKAQDGSNQTATVTDVGNGTYTFKVYSTTQQISLVVVDPTSAGPRVGANYTFSEATSAAPMVIKNVTSNAATVVADQYSVIGKITDGSGASVSGLTVTYATSKTVKSGSDGTIMIPAVSGSVTITTVSATGLTFATVKNAIKFDGITGNISYAAPAYSDILTFKSNEYKFTFSAADKIGNPLSSITFTYAVNGGSSTTSSATGSDGTTSIYVFRGYSVAVTGVQYAGALSTAPYNFTNHTGSYSLINSNTTASFVADEYTGRVSIADATSKVVDGISVTVAANDAADSAKITIVDITTATDNEGKRYFSYKFTGTDTTLTLKATATATDKYKFAADASTFVANTTSSVGVLASTSFTLNGSVSDASSINGPLFKDQIVTVTATTCKVDGEASKDVTVGADGEFSFVIAPSATPSDDDVEVKIKIATVDTFGYTYNTGTGGAAIKTVEGVTKDTTSFDLKANEITVKVSGTVSGLSLSATNLAAVKYTINAAAAAAKQVLTSTTGAYSFSYAKGSSITAVGVDTTSDTVDTGITNAAKDKNFTESGISYGKVIADKTQNFNTVAAAPAVSNVTIVATGNSAFTATTKVTMKYNYGSTTGEETVTAAGVAFNATFSTVSVPTDAVFKYTLTSKDYTTYEIGIIAGDLGALDAPVMVGALVQKITVSGASSAGDTKLAGIEIKYGLTTDTSIAPVYDLKAITDANGEISITVSENQYIVYDVQSNDTYTFVTDGLEDTWTSVNSTAIDIDANQQFAKYGLVVVNGLPLSGVTVDYDVYPTAESAPQTFAKTTETDEKGIFTVFVSASTDKIAVRISADGYEFVQSTSPVTYTSVYKADDFATAGTVAAKATGASMDVTVNVSYIASSSLDNTAESAEAPIVATSVTNVVIVGEKVTFTAPELQGFTFSGWYMDGVLVSDTNNKSVCNFTATSDMNGNASIIAVYSANVVTEPAPGINSTVLIIGIIAVVIALIAVAYVVIQCKKE